MRNIAATLMMMLLAMPGVVLAQGLSDREQARALLISHRGRLEARLADQVRRIGRLKQNAPGVRRDFQLEGALRQNRQLSEKLASLQQRINERTRAMAKAYEAALARSTDAKDKARLTRRLTSLRAGLGSPSARLVTDGQVSAMDSPEDLEEKADLLDDSREKLRRQLTRVKRHLATLHHRQRLRRHGLAADDTPFDENSTARTARVKGGAGNERAADSANNKQGGGAWQNGNYNGKGGSAPPGGLSGNPAPPAPNTGTGTTGGGERAAASSAGSSGLGLGDVTDPSLLQELSRPADQGGNLEHRIASLERADARLKKMLKTMSARSKKLRNQAKQIRTSK